MQFGSVPYEDLKGQDFSLPKLSQEVLPGKKAPNPKMFIGLPKWGRTDWVGTLYPPMTKEKEFLDHYVQHFNCIELNATHYKIYGEAGIKKWTEKAAGRDFKFSPKMYQGITHRGSLKGKDFITNEFFKSLDAFEDHLGPVYIQVSDTFSPKRKEELFEFLKKLPPKFTYFLEVRHPEWFSPLLSFEELTQNLLDLNIGLVITDTPGRRDAVHMKLTIPQVFIRFGCTRDHELDKIRINQWKVQLQKWFGKGLETCYFFLHIQNERKAIDFAKFAQEELSQVIMNS